MSRSDTRAFHLASCLAAIISTGCAQEPDIPTAYAESDEGFALATSDDEPPLEESDPSDESDTFAALASNESKHVFGADDRMPILDTSVEPYSAVVLITSHFTHGDPATCTGTLIADDAVLTAAHCVHDEKEGGGRAVRVNVVPGAFADKFGKQKALPNIGRAGGAHIFYPSNYRDPKGYNAAAALVDYAVIRLSVPLGRYVGKRRYAAAEKVKSGQAIHSVAYQEYACAKSVPTCVSGQAFQMYRVSGQVGALAGRQFHSTMDGVPGSSGAGITGDGLESDTIFAVDTSESFPLPEYNAALLLGPTEVANITRWVKAKLP